MCRNRESAVKAENRFAHGRPHRLARLIEAKLEILTDLVVRDLLEAGGTERGMTQEGPKLQERESVFRNDEQAVAQEFVGSCAEGVEMPPLAKDLREFRDLDESGISGFLFERIEAHRGLGIRRIDDDQALAQILIESHFLLRDQAQQEGSRIAVKIEKYKTLRSPDVLLDQADDETGLPASRAADDNGMFRATVLWNGYAPANVAIGDTSTNIEIPAACFRSSSRGAAIPEANDQFFEPQHHALSVRGATSKSVTNQVGEARYGSGSKNPSGSSGSC